VAEFIQEIHLPGSAIASALDASPMRGAPSPGSTFVAGPENRVVASTISLFMQSLFDRGNERLSRRLTPGVIALVGPNGSGKTQLARGVVGHWQGQCGMESSVYVTAADFRREFTDAIHGDAVLEFRRRYRELNLLAIDDLHRLPDNAYLLEELRNTLDVLEENGGAVIVTSTRRIGTLANIGPDIRSRLTRGVVLQLAPPGPQARVRIVRHKAAGLGRLFSNDEARQLAGRNHGTTNNLLGAVVEYCTTERTSAASDATARESLRADLAARRPAIHEIVAVVARYERLQQSQLKSSSRRRQFVFARGMVAYLARELSDASYEQIGRALGGRDHTTVIHSYRKIDRQRQRDPATQETLDELRRILLTR
jgi:chromosomal replication initiator protein